MKFKPDRKKLLVLGNGFDIAHKLPTKYTDFLIFIDGGSNKDVEVRKRTNVVLGCNNYILNKIKEDWSENQLGGENWVDFEQGISNIFRTVENKKLGTMRFNDHKGSLLCRGVSKGTYYA
jgi:hypothetical protein